MGTTQQMAKFIVNARYDDIPKPAIDMAKLCLLDAVGCAIYGSTRPLGKIMTSLTQELGGTPIARVLGTDILTNAVNAAMANGTLSHSDDYDDVGIGHMAVSLMPVVLALGEELHANGMQALTSYLVGFDITANVSHNIGTDHYYKGWHTTSSIGTLGSTAAAAKMLGLDEMQTRMALGIGATQAGGLRAHFGTMTKPFHPGNGTRAAVQAAKMAQKGYEGNPDIMEHRFGYIGVYGEEMAQIRNMARHLGNPWAIMGSGRKVANGIQIKVWPCCGGTFGGNAGISQLLRKHPFKAEDVESVNILTTGNPSTMPANVRRPLTGLQGKFSTWYTVAALIMDGGKLDLSSFTDDAVNRKSIQDFMRRVTIIQDPDMVGRPNRSLGDENWWDVSVTLKNGERLNTRVKGHGETYGWEDKEAVFEKFKTLAGSVLGPTQIDLAINALMEMDKASDVRTVMDTVTIPR